MLLVLFLLFMLKPPSDSCTVFVQTATCFSMQLFEMLLMMFVVMFIIDPLGQNMADESHCSHGLYTRSDNKI